MSGIGKGSLSFKKKDFLNQKTLAIGFKKIRFAHKATVGETEIDLTSLITPPELTTFGFVNPSSTELAAANILFFRENLKIVSSKNGELMDFLSYNIISNTKVKLLGTATPTSADEIFIGVLDPTAKTGIQAVDGTPLIKTGTLAVGVIEFNVGQGFEVNKFSDQQIGAILVYRNGVLQERNVSNATAAPSADGNYQEVAASGGLSNLIKFNVTPVGSEDAIVVLSNGLLVERPNASLRAFMESVNGVVLKMIPVLADAAGVSEATFSGSPSQIDLSTFGDLILAFKNEIFQEKIVGTSTQVTAGKATHSSLQSAIDAASAGDKILLLNGTFTETITVNKELFIQGKGRASVIDGTTAISADFCTISNVKFTDDVTVTGDGNHLDTGLFTATGKSIVESGAPTGNSIDFIQE